MKIINPNCNDTIPKISKETSKLELQEIVHKVKETITLKGRKFEMCSLTKGEKL